MRNLLICLVILALTGCSSSNAGLYPEPTRFPDITTITQPDGPLTAGSVVVFTVDWDFGLAPFIVTWDFGAAGQPQIVTSGAFENTHVANVGMLNPTGAPLTITGTVTVEDDFGSTDFETFTFTVEPQS